MARHSVLGGLDTIMRAILREVTVAKDTVGRVRVVLDNQPNVSSMFMNSGTAGQQRPWYDVNAVWSVEQREMHRQALAVPAQQLRAQWTFR